MIAIKKIVGCIYDDKGKLTHVIHYEEEMRRPLTYKVEPLGLDDVVDFLNTDLSPMQKVEKKK